MKNKLEVKKGTVQETLTFPLYGRKICNEKYPDVFADTQAAKIIDRIDYDFANANMGTGPTYQYGIRGDILVEAAREYLEQYPDAIIVNLGCGLDTSFYQLDNGQCSYVNLDFKEVIDFREIIFDKKDREINLAADAMDFSWMDQIGADSNSHVFVISGGVLIYFQPEDVRKLVDALAKRFPKGGMIFDYENKKLMMTSNRMVEKSGNNGARMYYYVDDADREIQAYSSNIASVQLYKRLPKKYSCIPGIYRTAFGIEYKKGMMGFAKIYFK